LEWLASVGLIEQDIFGPFFDEIRVTPAMMEVEEPAGGMVREVEEEHRQEDVLFGNEQPSPEEEAIELRWKRYLLLQ